MFCIVDGSTKYTVVGRQSTSNSFLNFHSNIEHICTVDTDNISTNIQRECVAAFRWQQRPRERARMHTAVLLIMKHIPQLPPIFLYAYKLSDVDPTTRAV